MAKKTRPTFSAPRAKPAAQATKANWVYRSDPAPAATSPAVAARPAPVLPAVARRAPRQSSAIVNCAAILLFPLALISGLIVEPLTACCRRKT